MAKAPQSSSQCRERAPLLTEMAGVLREISNEGTDSNITKTFTRKIKDKPAVSYPLMAI